MRWWQSATSLFGPNEPTTKTHNVRRGKEERKSLLLCVASQLVITPSFCRFFSLFVSLVFRLSLRAARTAAAAAAAATQQR